MSEISFEELVKRRAGKLKLPSRLMAIDPGLTTGIAFFENYRLTERRQVKIEDPDPNVTIANKLNALFDYYRPTQVVCEDYRVYGTHAKQHIGTELITAKLVGRIEHICEERNIPCRLQMAAEGKGFATDPMLKKMDIIDVTKVPHAERHGIDAVRHGVHFLLFH